MMDFFKIKIFLILPKFLNNEAGVLPVAIYKEEYGNLFFMYRKTLVDKMASPILVEVIKSTFIRIT